MRPSFYDGLVGTSLDGLHAPFTRKAHLFLQKVTYAWNRISLSARTRAQSRECDPIVPLRTVHWFEKITMVGNQQISVSSVGFFKQMVSPEQGCNDFSTSASGQLGNHRVAFPPTKLLYGPMGSIETLLGGNPKRKV